MVLALASDKRGRRGRKLPSLPKFLVLVMLSFREARANVVGSLMSWNVSYGGSVLRRQITEPQSPFHCYLRLRVPASGAPTAVGKQSASSSQFPGPGTDFCQDACESAIWLSRGGISQLIRIYPMSSRSARVEHFLDVESALQPEDQGTKIESPGRVHFPKHFECRILRDCGRSL